MEASCSHGLRREKKEIGENLRESAEWKLSGCRRRLDETTTSIPLIYADHYGSKQQG